MIPETISQNILNGLPFNSVQAFMVPRGWIPVTLAIVNFSPGAYSRLKIFTKFSTITLWIGAKAYRHLCFPDAQLFWLIFSWPIVMLSNVVWVKCVDDNWMDCPEIWYKYSCPPEAELLKLSYVCMVFIFLSVVVLSIILLCLLILSCFCLFIYHSIIAVSCSEFPSEGSIMSCLIFGDCLTSYLA